MNFGQFVIEESSHSLFMTRQRISLFRWLTRKAPPLYLRGGDIMTVAPMVTGYYERETVALLGFLATSGFNEALVDIGANIGLITYYCRDMFRSFHCFEPNPRVFHVLSANLEGIFQDRSDSGAILHLHNFAVGDRDGTCPLRIPQHNHGGAFILGPANAYDSDNLLARGAQDEVAIDLRRGRDVFTGLFRDMPRGNFVIKLDTEGFEQTIISELAAAMPEHSRIAIVSENLAAGFDAKRFLERTFRCGTALKLADNIERHRSRFARELVKLTKGKIHRLTGRPVDWVGTILFVIDRR